MSTYVGFALAGLGGGAVVAALGLGLVLSFRTSGVVNFAHAATGTYLAFAYFEFRDRGDLVLPILGLPDRVHILATPTLATALFVLLVLAAAVGLVLYLLVFRPLRSSTPLARVVASLGLFLYFQEVVRIRFPTAGAAVIQRFPVLPETRVELLGTAVSANRLWLVVLAVGGALVLAAVFRWTRFGLVTRAAAASDKGALLMGLRGDRAGAVNWMVATVLAGFAVVLIEPIAGLDPTTTSLLVVPALAAALIGGLSSFVVTVAAGIGIGIVQSMILGYVVQPSVTWIPDWLPAAGLQQVVPVVVILAALALRGDVLPGRSAVPERRPSPVPTPRRPIVGPALLASGGLVLAFTLDAAGRRGLVVSMTFAVLALSVIVICGYAGQISLAQLALAGIAGFAVVHFGTAGIPFPVDLLLASALAAGIGTIIGLSASRLRGMTFAVATLAIAVSLEQLVLASPSFSGGAAGRRAPRPTLFGLDLGSAARGADDVRPAFVVTVLVVLVLSVVAVINLRRSHTGLRWLAIRANPRAAAAAGVDVTRSRLVAFACSAALAGLSGGLTAYSTSALSPASFMVIGSLVVVALAYLGGISSVIGAIVAGLIAQAGLLTAVTGASGTTGGDQIYAWSGIALVLAALFAPEGVVGLCRRLLPPRLDGRRAVPARPASARTGPAQINPARTSDAHPDEAMS